MHSCYQLANDAMIHPRRLGVPVSDVQRSKLERIDRLQQDARTKIYDRLVNMEVQYPRTIFNASKRMQSMYRMVKGKQIAHERRHMLSLKGQGEATIKDVTRDMGMSKDDIIERLAKAVSQPLTNRFWNMWVDFREKAKVYAKDTSDMYAQMCSTLGATPSGFMSLKKLAQDPYCNVRINLALHPSALL